MYTSRVRDPDVTSTKKVNMERNGNYVAILSFLMISGVSATLISANYPTQAPATVTRAEAPNDDASCNAPTKDEGLVAKLEIAGNPQEAKKTGGGGGQTRRRPNIGIVGDNTTFTCSPEARGCPGQQKCVLIKVGTADGYCECQSR